MDKQQENIPSTILEALDYYGIEYKMVGSRPMLCCLFHKDDTPSMAIYPETNSFHCFGCGQSGTVENIVMHMEGCTYQQALSLLYGEGYEWMRLRKKPVKEEKVNTGYLYSIIGRNIKKKLRDKIKNNDALDNIKCLLLKYSKTEVNPAKLLECLKDIKNS